MSRIISLDALEILDSRGRPTVRAACALAGGYTASASVPSGASTGQSEAHELRDEDLSRFGGFGCRKAVMNIIGEIQSALKKREFDSQQALDGFLVELDSTPDKSRLGANALLAVSLAFARASAMERGVPLYDYFAALLGGKANSLPRPTINLFSGGKHAGAQVPFQDILIVAPKAESMHEVLEVTYAVYQSAVKLCGEKYGMRLLRADEGGLAPPFPSVDAMFEDLLVSIESAGYKPGDDVTIAVDAASSHFYREGFYHLSGQAHNGQSMIDYLAMLAKKYPIVSIEDGLAEEDWDHWQVLNERIGKHVLVLGDDLLCTNPARIQKAVEMKAANALLLKVNQIGTLSEAAEACRLAYQAKWRVTISARSGETEDHWLADLAVGWNGDQIKIGSITQSERLSKYNRLLQIEKETGLSIVHWGKR